MRSGILLQCPVKNDNTYVDAYADLQNEVEVAEACGFETCWLSEAHGMPRFCGVPAPLLVLASLTGTTRTIRLGTAAVIAPYYLPIQLAEQAAMLDCLSRGRLRLGIGRAPKSSPDRILSAGQSSDSDILQETLDLMTDCWSRGESVRDGRTYRFPRPVQTRAPIHIVCNSPATVDWSAGRCLPIILTSMNHGLSRTLLDMIGRYRQKAARGVGGSSGVSIVFACYVSDSEADIRETFLHSLSEYLETTGVAASAESFLADSVIAGSREECRRQITYVASVTGADEIVFWFNPGGLIPQEKVLASMRTVGDVLSEMKSPERLGAQRAA